MIACPKAREYSWYRRDHEVRNAWIGPAFPLDLSMLPTRSEQVPLQYPSLSASYVQNASRCETDVIRRLFQN